MRERNPTAPHPHEDEVLGTTISFQDLVGDPGQRTPKSVRVKDLFPEGIF